MRKSKKTKKTKRSKKCIYTDDAKRIMKRTRKLRGINEKILNHVK